MTKKKSDECRVIRVDFAKKTIIGEDIHAHSPTKRPTGNKLEVFTAMIHDGLTSTVFRPDAPGVKVHDSLRGQQHVIFNWSHRFGLDDFTYDEQGIGGTLSVSGQAQYVFLPWDSVAGMYPANDYSAAVFWFDEEAKDEAGATPIMEDGFRIRARKALLKGFRKFFKSKK